MAERRRSVARARTARWLVRVGARWYGASYAAYVRRDKGEMPGWWDRPWHAVARCVNRVTLPLAHRLDSDATGTEMAEHGWWG